MMIKTKKSILFFLIGFILFSSVIYGKSSCREVFTQSDINSLCNIFVSEVKKKGDDSLIIEKVKKFVFEKIKIGEKRALNDSDECYKTEGLQIDLFYEDKNGVKIDKLLSFGKTDSSTITVKSCQHKENGGDIFAEISVHIFRTPSETELMLSSEKNHLSLNEASKVKIRIKCGDCYLSGKKIILNSTAAGEISPKEVITDENGSAMAVFKLKESSSAKLTASYKEVESSLIFNPEKLLWNLEVTVNYEGKRFDDHYCSIRFDKPKLMSHEKFNYKARFENIPLNNYVELARNYPIIANNISKMATISNPIDAKSSVELKKKYFYCDCMTCGSCKNCRYKREDYNGSSNSFISFGLPIGKIKKPKSLIITFFMGGIIDTGNKKFVFNLDPIRPYIKENNLSDIFGKYTMPVYIPFDKIKSIQPFYINYSFSVGKDKNINPKIGWSKVWNFRFKFYPAYK